MRTSTINYFHGDQTVSCAKLYNKGYNIPKFELKVGFECQMVIENIQQLQ